MKTVLSFLGLSFLIFASCPEQIENNTTDRIDLKVDSLLSLLTLEDKIGEMTQFSIDVLSKGQPYKLEEPHTLDSNKMQNILVDLKVGSILNVGGHAYTREHWKEIIEPIQEYATQRKSTGIPVLYGIDAIHGTNYTQGATLFPQQLGQASSWNREIAKNCGDVTAYETRASGIPWSFSPVMDLGIDARWPRLWETYGEDVFLSSELGKHYTNGMQGDDMSDKYKVAVCLKHFLGYSYSRRGKDRMPAWIPERQMREYFLPGFQKLIDAGAKTIMICSGEINGIPVHANKQILVDLLRNELGFTGVTVSDWEDVIFLKDRHRVAATFKEAIEISVNAGVDMAMVPLDTDYPILLKELVEEGKVSMQRIDEATRRILKLKYELGLFDHPFYDFDLYQEFGSNKHKALAKNAADESIIMLRNDGTLPLKKESKLLVIGPTADDLQCLNGGWTGTWQGNDSKYYTPYAKTLLQALQDKFGSENIINSSDLNKNEVEQSDVLVLCLGELAYTEKVGDIDDLTLPKDQLDLVLKAKSFNKPVILILLQGRPRIINSIVSSTNAILLGLLPGNHGSEALADILVGDVNPSGKLPITYPKHVNDLVNYNFKGTDKAHRDYSMNGFNPQYEFGFGLSYSRFTYSDMVISQDTFSMNDEIRISINVTNESSVDGKEVVQLYISDLIATITPEEKRLRGFEKILLKAGESKTVNFTVSSQDLAFIGIDNTWQTEKGDFRVHINKYSHAFHLN